MRKEEIAYIKGYRITEEGKAIGLKSNELSLLFTNTKYLSFTIRINGLNKQIKVHRLQAYQKFGEKIYEKNIVVRHLNGITTDNNIKNIHIGTQSQNIMDIPEQKRIAKAKHASSFIKKFNHDDVYSFYLNCKSYKKTMNAFGINSKSALHHIIKTKG